MRGAGGRHEWFWEPGDEDAVYSLDALMSMYEKSVGRNATLILGLTPDPDGLLPEGDVRRLEEWGAEIERRYGSPVAGTSGQGDTLLVEGSAPEPIGRCVISEDIRAGERIRKFRIEARKQDGLWKTVYSGTSVGHKHIAVFDNPVEATAFRLVVDSRRATPRIAEFSIFH